MKAFLDRPIEGDWPCLWLDAPYVKVRQNSRVVSAAVIVAVGVNSDGRREGLGMAYRRLVEASGCCPAEDAGGPWVVGGHVRALIWINENEP